MSPLTSRSSHGTPTASLTPSQCQDMLDTSKVLQSAPACRGMPKLRSGHATGSHRGGGDALGQFQPPPRCPTSSTTTPLRRETIRAPPLPCYSLCDACLRAPVPVKAVRPLMLDSPLSPSAADDSSSPKPRPKTVVSTPALLCTPMRATVSHRRSRIGSPSRAY